VIQVLQLKVTIGNLVMAMIEENSIESLVVAKVRQCFLPRARARIRAYTHARARTYARNRQLYSPI